MPKSPWKDVINHQPPDGQLLGARRQFPWFAPVEGTWRDALAAVEAGQPGTPWVLPASACWDWKPIASLPPWPLVNPRQDWQDVWNSPPPDGAICYIRRFGPFTAAIVATWSAATASFAPDVGPVPSIPWYLVHRWRPHPSWANDIPAPPK